MADVTLTIDANTARYIAQLNRMAGQTKQAGDKTKKALNFGDVVKKGLPVLARFAGALGPVGALSAGILATWTKILQTQDEAARKMEGSADQRGRFLTLFDIRNQAKQASAQVDKLRASGLSDSDAYGAGFAAQSRGVFNHLEQFGQVRQTGQISDTGAFIDSVADLMQAFGKSNSDVPDIINQLFTGARESKADLGQFTKVMGEMGVLAKTTGTSFEELAGYVASLGGEGMERLRTKVNALQGASLGSTKGLTAVVAELEKLSDAQLLKRLGGNKEAIVGVRMLADASENAARMRGAITGARGQDVVGQALSTARQADTGFAYTRDLQAQQQRTAMSEEGAGRRGLLNDQITELYDEIIQLKGGAGSTFLSHPLDTLAHYSRLDSGLRRTTSSESDLLETAASLRELVQELRARNRQRVTGAHEERRD